MQSRVALKLLQFYNTDIIKRVLKCNTFTHFLSISSFIYSEDNKCWEDAEKVPKHKLLFPLNEKMQVTKSHKNAKQTTTKMWKSCCAIDCK